MIGVSTQTYDIDGSRIFPFADVAHRAGKRRVSRTATLDGGVSIYDTGYSDSDRDVTVREPDATVEAIEFARYIVETYGLVNLAMDDGAYEGVPESYGIDSSGDLELKILITEKLST